MPKTNALHGLTILDAIDSPHLLGAAFKDPASWAPWRAFLAALFGLPMDDASTALYRACTGRTAPPAQLFQFAWLVIGRRGGKSFTMALVAVFLALFRDWRPFLSPGERAVIQIVAADREQAKIIRRYVAGILQASRLLAQFIESETADGLELRGGVVIEVATRSFRTVRGRSVAVAILDELAYWRADDSANPDVEVLNAMRAAQATFGDSAVMIAASSPYSRRGVLWDAYRKFYGKDDAQNLVWQAATRQMNPQVPQSFIDSETERDPANAAAEYGASFRSDIESFVSREAVEACVSPGILERPPMSDVHYFGFTDTSGGGADSFTMAVSHMDDGVAVLDALREVRPPFSPEGTVVEFCALLKSYRIGVVRGDAYAGEWPREQRKCGVDYLKAERVRSDIYIELLPLMNSRRVDLLDDKRLIAQLVGLERRTGRAGKDTINHADGAHDDLANSAAGALVLAQVRPPMPAYTCGQSMIAFGGRFYDKSDPRVSHLQPIPSPRYSFRVGAALRGVELRAVQEAPIEWLNSAKKEMANWHNH